MEGMEGGDREGLVGEGMERDGKAKQEKTKYKEEKELGAIEEEQWG